MSFAATHVLMIDDVTTKAIARADSKGARYA